MSNEPAWVDQVLAVPVIGILTSTWMGFSPGIWSALERLGERWEVDSSINVRSVTALRVDRKDGLYMELGPSNMTFGYTYQVNLREQPGALPALDSVAEIKPFTELLDSVLSEALSLVSDVGAPQKRKVLRIGVLADCRLVEDQAPPGIESFLDANARMWNRPLQVVDANFLLELRKGDGFREQCHHALSKNAYDRPKDLRVRLDWQRFWDPSRTVSRTELHEELKSTASQASEYFAEFGANGGHLCPAP